MAMTMYKKPQPSQQKQRKNKPKPKPKEKKTVIYVEPKPQVTGPNATCLLEFAAIRAQPFTKLESMPCNPIYDEGFSTKRCIYSRHQFSAGTTGNAFFVVNCRLGIRPITGTQFFHTSNTFAGSGINTSSIPVGVIADNPVFPYSTASAPAPEGWKLVAMGIKIRPVGPYLNTSGMIYRISVPRNAPINKLDQAQIAAGVNYPWMPVKHGKTYQVNF
jgi:hypothetical protein